MLQREGVTRGTAPTVELLSLGAKNPARHPSDLLPYLPRYRQFYSPLPKEVAEMELKICKIPLGDIDALTETTVNHKRPTWTFGVKKGRNNIAIMSRLITNDVTEAIKFAGEFIKTCGSWEDPQWNEMDWSRIKELTTRDILELRNMEGIKAQQAQAFNCRSFVKHVSSDFRCQ